MNLLVVLLWSTLSASAQSDVAESAYRAATAAEADGEPERARDAWREVAASAAGSRLAARAERRLAWLEERSEGNFAPLGVLLRFQALRDPSPEALDAFAAAIDAMPEGRVRTEATLLLASSRARAGDTEGAASAYRAVIASPATREEEVRLSRDELAGALAAGGDVDGALRELEDAGMSDWARHGVLMRAARRRFLEPIAWSSIGLFAVLVVATVRISRGTRRALAVLRDPRVLGVVAVLGLGPFAVARLAGDEATSAFMVFGMANAAAVLAAFAAGRALPEAPARVHGTLAILLVLTVIASGYLSVLYRAPSLPFA